jgi:hypothetical protein
MTEEVTNTVDAEVAAEITAAVDAVVDESKAGDETAPDSDGTETDASTQEVEDTSTAAPVEDSQADETDTENAPDEAGSEGAGISDELLERAVKAGMEREDAEAFASEEMLTRTLGLLETRTPESEPAQEDADTSADEPADFDDILASIPEFDPEEYDEGIVSAFAATKKVIAELHKANKELMQGAQARQVEEAAKWFDGQIVGLGDEYAEVLGKGTRSDLDPKGGAYAKRAEVAERMAVLEAGYQKLGKEIPNHDALFKEAVEAVVGPVRSKLKKRAEAHISKPGRNKASQKLSVEEAIAAEIDEKFFGK